MASLLFPDAGSRRAEDTGGRPAVGKPAIVYADSAGTTLAEIYADNAGVPGALIASATLTTDAYGFLPLFWGPASGADKLWIAVNSGPVWPIDADYNTRLDALEAGGGGGGGGNVAAHEADTTNIHGIADTTLLETQTGAQAKVDVHNADSTAVHGIADTAALETQVGAQAKVNAHNAITAGIHGIADTSVLETTAGAQAKANAAQAAAVASSAQRAANLSDLASASTARTNLGLGSAATRDVGTSTGTVAAGDDSRLTDARIPTAHATSHGAIGTDPVTVAQAQVTGLTAALTAKADLVGGLVPSSQLPDLVINATYTVENEAEMLALAAGVGDVAIRIDLDPVRFYILTDPDPSVLDNWLALNLAGSVASVNGQSGAVTLSAADVGAAPALRTLTAGAGLTGGGTLAADRTFDVTFGTTAGTVAAGDDTRIVGAAQAAANLADLGSAAAARTNLGLGTAAVTNTGTGASNTILGSDTRLTDARTPTLHAATHGTGGSDPVTVAQAQVTGLTAALAGKQDSDADLTTIAALTPSNDDVLQRKAGAWTARTPAQVKTDLALVKGDVGLGNVDNTSDASKNTATATLTNKTVDGNSGNKLKVRRAANASLPAGGTEAGELRFATDTQDLYVDDGASNVRVGGSSLVAATSSVTGGIRLAGDLTGTATAPTIAAAAVGTSKIADDAVTAAKIADGTITDAEIAAGAAVAQSKISGLTAALAAKVAKGDLVVNVRDYGATGDGTTDDTSAINTALAAAGPGGTVWFPKPPSGGYYRITAALTPLAGTAVVGAGYGCEIRQMTTLKPVFDLFNVDNCTISGFTLTYGLGPATGMGGPFRGDAGYNYSCGVWSNGHRHLIENLRIKDFPMGVYLNGSNGTINADGTQRVGNVVRNLEISGANMGVLFLTQTGLRISDIYYHDGVDSSAGVNPLHGVYGTGTTSLPSYDVTVSDCVIANCPTGCAVQVKYVTGLTVTNIQADNTFGLFNGIDIFDVTVSNMTSRGDITTGASGFAFTLQSVNNYPSRINIANVVIQMASDGAPMILIANKVRGTNIALYGNHSGASTSNYDLHLRGTDITLDGVTIHNLGTSYYKGILAGATGYTAGNITVTNLVCQKVRQLVDFDTSLTGTNVVDYSPGVQRDILTGANLIDQTGGTAAFNTVRREWVRTTTVAGAGTYSPIPALETVTRLNVTSTAAFTIGAPACQPKIGMTQTILVVNAAGAPLGTITWNAAYVLKSTFVAPPSGDHYRIMFTYDGTVWRETNRTSKAAVPDVDPSDAPLTGLGVVAPSRRALNNSAVSTLASGTMTFTYFTAPKTETVTTVSASTGATAAAATPTLVRFGVYTVDTSDNLTLAASTASDTTLFAATNTEYARTLSSSLTLIAGQRYACSLIVVTAATLPTFVGCQMPAVGWLNTLSRLAPATAGRLTGQTDLPSSVTAGSITGYQAMIGFRLS